MYDVRKSCSGKDLLKLQDTRMDFNITKYEELIDMVSNSTLQLSFKKLPLIELWYQKEYL